MLAANYGVVPLSPDQEFQAGFACNGVAAVAPNAANRAGVPVSSAAGVNICGATALTSGLVKIPAPNTENDDKNPPHVQPRNLFDLAIGDDNLFHGDKYRRSAQLMMINIANNDALYGDAANGDRSDRLSFLTAAKQDCFFLRCGLARAVFATRHAYAPAPRNGRVKGLPPVEYHYSQTLRRVHYMRALMLV
jgi:hypothetical protein